MGLVSSFEQRALGATYSSIRSRKQLRFPSGPQFTESSLESAVVDQLSFSPFVGDLITQAIINFEEGRRYTADVVVDYVPPDEPEGERFMIEAKRQVDLVENAKVYAQRLGSAREWCHEHRVHWCLLDDTDIRTVYLANARLLKGAEEIPVPSDNRDVVVTTLKSGPRSVAATITACDEDHGLTEQHARTAVEAMVASRLLDCDLTKPFGEGTILALSDLTKPSPGRRDPFLATLRKASALSRT